MFMGVRQLFLRIVPGVVLAGAMLVVAGCAPTRMALPSGLGTAKVLPVSGRQDFKLEESFRFGSYQVRAVSRGWKVATSWSAFGYDSKEAKQSFEFTFGLAGGTWAGQGATGVDRKLLTSFWGDLPVTWDLKDQTTYAVTFTPAEGQAIRLAVAGSGEGVLRGYLTGVGQPIEVRGTQEIEGSPLGISEAAGYVFRRASNVLGVVEVINEGRVLLAPGLSQADQDAIAGASAALLLYRSLE